MSPLNRNDRLKILNGLPSAFDDLLPNSLAVHLAKLWVVSSFSYFKYCHYVEFCYRIFHHCTRSCSHVAQT